MRTNMSTDEELEADKRSKTVDSINAALSSIRIAKLRCVATAKKHAAALHAANSEMGTADSELEKAKRIYVSLRDKLVDSLPDTEDINSKD